MNKFVKKIGWIVALSVFLLTMIGVSFFNSPLEKLQAADSKKTTNQLITNSFSNEATKTEQEKIIDPLADTQMRALSKYIVLGASIYGAAEPNQVIIDPKPAPGDRTYTMEWPYDYWPDPNTNTELQQKAFNSAADRGNPFKVLTGIYKKPVKLLPNPIVAAGHAGYNKLPSGETTAENNPEDMFQWPNIPPHFKDITKYSSHPAHSADGWPTLMFWYSAIFEGDEQYLEAEPIEQTVKVGHPTGSAKEWTVTKADIEKWVQNVNLVYVDNPDIKEPVPSGYTVEFIDAMRTIDVSEASDDQFINVKVSYKGLSRVISIPIKVVDDTPPPVEEPLKIEFTKYQEDGKTPLAGAKFIVQRQLANGNWTLMNPAAANGEVVFTTNAQGKITISESENTAFWNSMKQYGGNSENMQFRFREISAPSGYEQPPGYDVSNPMQESDSDSALAPFVTKAFFVDKNTTGTIDQTLTNKKAKLIVALHKVNESGQSLPGAVLVLQSQKRSEQNNWSTVVTSGLTTADVTFTTDSNGYAYLPEKLIDNMRTYGKDYEYRFREITAPSGYATPPAYSGGKEADGSPAGFISEVFQVDGTTNANKTITVVNYTSAQPQQGGDVTVNYYKKGTTTKLADSVTLKGKVGEAWQSTRNATITKDGVTYTLDDVAKLDGMDVSSDPALKGTFTANQRTVNYYYTEPSTPTTPGDITINYYQDGTYVDRRVIEGSKFGLGAEVGIPKLPLDQSGWSDYEFQKVVIGSNTYTDWSKVPMVTITTSNQTVSVYYVKKTVQPGGAVTVNYYQKGTTTKLANSVTLTGNIGENWVSTRPETIVKDGVTYELEEAAQLDGIDVASSPALSLPFIAASRTLNYYYSAKEAPAGGDVTVNYYEKGTTTKLAESVILKGKVDESWQSTRNTTITKDGVQYTLDAIATFDGMDVSSDPAVSGIFDANQRTVNYYYNKVVVEEPLKIVFTKYAEDGKTPLAGAKFVMQRQLSNDNWALMNPAAANGEVVFTTNAQGQIIISNTENKAFWDSMKLYGGNVSNRNFRFREISAPSGYQQPPTYNVESPVEETNTAENLKGFVTEAFYVDSKTTGSINQSLVNKKESATPGKITVYYYQDDQYVEGSKRELTGFNIGSEVTIPKSLVGDFSNYEFSHAYVNYTTNKETTWPFTVTVTSEDQTVWVYYEKKVVTPTAAPINVYYYIQGTTTSVNDMISFVPIKPIGDLVEAEAKTSYTYQGDTYKLVSYKVDNGSVTSTSNPIKVEVKSTAQTVVYYYEKQEVGTVNSIKVIKYDDSTPRKPLKGAKFSLQWKNSGSSLWTGIGLGFESDENGVAEVPAEYVQSVNTLEGQWKIVETDPPTGFEKVGNGETEIFMRNSGTDLQFEMVNKRKDGGKVTVNYFIENTETPLVTSKTLTGKYEEEWTAARETVITKDGIEYTLKSAVFNNNPVADVNTPVSGKFTLNAQTVTYYYEAEDLGDITWNVPPTMDFGEVTVPLMKDLDQYLIQDAQKPWQIQVEDERKNRDPWRISARLEKEFVSKTNGQTLSSILKFKEGSVDQTLTTTAPVDIYQSKTQPDVLTTIDWQSPNGFYLGLKALGSYPVGEANATVEFVLITEP